MPLQLPLSNTSFPSPLTRQFWTPKNLSKLALRSVPIARPLPLRIRPAFVLVTAIVLILLGLLGFSKTRHSLIIPDKPLHFICFAFATALFFWIWEVEEHARRLWYWRRAPAIITAIICFFFGGLISEVVQGLLPAHVFDWGDVLCNWLGSCLGLFLSEKLESYYRHRKELRRLYQPLDAADDDYEEEDDAFDVDTSRINLGSNTPNPPNSTSTHSPAPNSVPHQTLDIPQQPRSNTAVNKDVWGASEEIFSLGDDDT